MQSAVASPSAIHRLSSLRCLRQQLRCAALPLPSVANFHAAIPLPGSRHCCGTPPIELALQTSKTSSPETTHRPNETKHRLTKEKSKSHEQKQQLPTSRRRDETEQIPCNQKKAHTYLDPKHSDWAGSVGAKASVNAERSCVTGSHLSPSFALMPPATARLRSSSRPNSCKRPRSHSAPLFLVLLRNSSHRKPSDERRNWSILPDNPFKQWNCHRATLTRVPGTRLEQKACSACSASNLYPFKLAKLSLPPRKHPSSRHSNH